MAEDVSTEVSMQPRVALNQAGYLPGAVKIATVIPRDAANAEFKLYPAAEPRPVLRGTLSAPVLDGASGNHVAFADISKWTTPGRYRLSVGELSSEDFEIGKDVYREPLRLAMRAFYGQRCGCAVDLGNGYSHPACHLEGKYHLYFRGAGGRRVGESWRLARCRGLWPLCGEQWLDYGYAALGVGALSADVGQSCARHT